MGSRCRRRFRSAQRIGVSAASARGVSAASDRLHEGGYFQAQPRAAIRPAKPDAAKKLAAVEKLINGPLPLSVRAFYETLDAVSLAVPPAEAPSGKDTFDPELCQRDPLVIAPLAVVLADLKLQVAANRGYLPDLREP